MKNFSASSRLIKFTRLRTNFTSPRNISNVVLENPIIIKLPMRKIIPIWTAPKFETPKHEQSLIPTTAPTAFENNAVPRK